MAGLIEHIIRASGHKLRAHACRWAALPEITVESAAVDDEQTEQWSRESYEDDLELERKYPPRPLALIAFLALLLIVGIASAADVKADPENANEAAFIEVLNEEGVYYPSADDDDVLEAGYQVCDARNQGITEMEIATAIFKNSKLTAYQSGYFVGAAEAAFCPEMLSAFEKRVRS